MVKLGLVLTEHLNRKYVSLCCIGELLRTDGLEDLCSPLRHSFLFIRPWSICLLRIYHPCASIFLDDLCSLLYVDCRQRGSRPERYDNSTFRCPWTAATLCKDKTNACKAIVSSGICDFSEIVSGVDLSWTRPGNCHAPLINGERKSKKAAASSNTDFYLQRFMIYHCHW